VVVVVLSPQKKVYEEADAELHPLPFLLRRSLVRIQMSFEVDVSSHVLPRLRIA